MARTMTIDTKATYVVLELKKAEWSYEAGQVVILPLKDATPILHYLTQGTTHAFKVRESEEDGSYKPELPAYSFTSRGSGKSPDPITMEFITGEELRARFDREQVYRTDKARLEAEETKRIGGGPRPVPGDEPDRPF